MAEKSQIEAEPVKDDEYSDYGSSIESETQSLVSSLHHYLEQNGRRYHTYYGPDKNYMPNDDTEKSRLDIAHECILSACHGRLHQAPVSDNLEIQRVLDLGTGTGVWACDFAFENPHAQVLGMDLSPIQSTWVPPNCQFEVDDFELEWTWKNNFDFIHARTISQSVSNWPRLLEQAFSHLNAGGWLETSEMYFVPHCDDGTMPDDWPPLVLWGIITEALIKANRAPPPTKDEMKQMMADAGFTDIATKTVKLPSGSWPKDPVLKQAGAFSAASAQTGYVAYAMALCTRVMGMDEEEVKELCRKASEAHLDRRVHAYWNFHVVYGRKPKAE